jgi:hypothetical protein
MPLIGFGDLTGDNFQENENKTLRACLGEKNIFFSPFFPRSLSLSKLASS